MNKINRIIGVDPGLNKTGFGILDYKGSQVKTVAYGLISPPSKESLPNRLEYLHSHMNELIDKLSVYAEAGVDEFIISSSFGQEQNETIESMHRVSEEIIPYFKNSKSQVA